MSRKAAFTSEDVTRVVRGALKAGLPAGSFVIEVVDGIVRLLPATGAAPLPSANDAESEWDKALGTWRPSA